MSEQDGDPGVVRYVEVQRISTGSEETLPLEERVGVIPEAPLSIDVEGAETYTVLCTPTDVRALALGFLFSEGVIDRLDEVTHLEPCLDAPNVIRVRLAGKVPRLADPGRNLLIVSSCGACGDENLEAKIKALPPVGDTLRIPGRVLRSVTAALREKQPLFDACGGTHAAGVFDARGELLSWAEDAGRHNALDKAIGKCLLAGIPTAGCGVVLSSRVSLEMASKCARAGVEVIAAISAATTLAVEVAERCQMTLCAFVRGTRASVFTHPHRIASRRR